MFMLVRNSSLELLFCSYCFVITLSMIYKLFAYFIVIDSKCLILSVLFFILLTKKNCIMKSAIDLYFRYVVGVTVVCFMNRALSWYFTGINKALVQDDLVHDLLRSSAWASRVKFLNSSAHSVFSPDS